MWLSKRDTQSIQNIQTNSILKHQLRKQYNKQTSDISITFSIIKQANYGNIRLSYCQTAEQSLL